MIARILKTSYRTVEQHIDQLRFKFDASHKWELIGRALEAGYLGQIPASLFSRQLPVVLREM